MLRDKVIAVVPGLRIDVLAGSEHLRMFFSVQLPKENR